MQDKLLNMSKSQTVLLSDMVPFHINVVTVVYLEALSCSCKYWTDVYLSTAENSSKQTLCASVWMTSDIKQTTMPRGFREAIFKEPNQWKDFGLSATDRLENSGGTARWRNALVIWFFYGIFVAQTQNWNISSLICISIQWLLHVIYEIYKILLHYIFFKKKWTKNLSTSETM